MVLGVCFSGGKDSALAALLLEPHYDVRLVGCTFGVSDAHEHAREAAESLGLPFERVDLDEEVATAAVERMVADGYPRNGIQSVHEHALERVATSYPALADGTRRDDRVPSVDRPFVQSLEDRHGVNYVRPLAGFGRGAIDDLADRSLSVETGPSEAVPKGDYEAELRALIVEEHGAETVREVFPDHVQSRVRGRA
ncbi:asparagine synthase-related protein [Haloarculaceae archaeon H-GB11]|nr:asparagine synthase-related protein [Haloarculaceae archaeon H-GB1-1]MEA5385681.1 asparagine synthase-related protein [Haloarculaceae archaeon H-GB11]